ncbi:hypothetical protein DTO027B5_2890 [Paecilomyces variotii]|nr:hypothetical protein DTO169C6_1548 [Paecilomyces variotii]KAJ9289901.1 hypothetical protein DTO021C3_2615 [Paecilomyces variotii]KAJ9323616.1 hypothetical protein DTO027B3_5235 [Paecilomyces variotii]KAJ9335473.1 hypothetical protein DTO027B5_2890 [Paecilomyces variotii]KAJ9395336.1 hypothetical protein DTO282F9_7695 [Paecilomyces variotii]
MALSYLRQAPHLSYPLKRAFSFKRGVKKDTHNNEALPPITEKSPVQEITSKTLGSTPTSEARSEEDAVPEGMMRIPDLFVSWAAQKPRVNPFYEEVKPQVEEWFKVKCKLDDAQYNKFVAADLCWFAAVWAPDADKEAFRLACHWVGWVFVFDDRIDEGVLKYKTDIVREEIDTALSRLGPDPAPYSEEQGEMLTFDLICQEIKKCSKGLQERFLKKHLFYMNEVLEQTEPEAIKASHDLESFIDHHRGSVGIYPIYPILEYCNNLNLPDYVFESASVQKLEALAAEIVLLTNDSMSYLKEAVNGDEHNLIMLLRQQGLSQEAAYQRLGEEITRRYQEWYVALAELPLWGEEIDTQVQRYVAALQETVLANLNWSFHTKRYFGKGNEIARKQRLIKLIP